MKEKVEKLGKKKKTKMMPEPACLFSSSSSTSDITQRDEDDAHHFHHEKDSQDNSCNIHPHPDQDLVSYSSGQLFYNRDQIRHSQIVLTHEEGIKNKDRNCHNNRQEKNSTAHKSCIFNNRYSNKCHRFLSLPILLILVTLSLPCFIPSASSMNPAKGAALQQQKTEQLQQKDQLIQVVINYSN